MPDTVADVQHGNKHGHHLSGGIVLALPFNRYFSCLLLVLSGQQRHSMVKAPSLTRIEKNTDF